MRNRKLGVALALAAGLAISSPLAADELTPQKSADIVQLYEMMGGAGLGQQLAASSVKGIVASLKARRPDLDERVLTVVERESVAFFEEKITPGGELYGQLVPLYHMHYSHEDILTLIAFYRTPLGQRILTVGPQINQESMAVIKGWTSRWQPEFTGRLQAALAREGLQVR